MDKKHIEQGTVIGNVNVLDLTRATEQSVAAIKKIGNVNVLIYSKENASLVPRLAIENLNISLEVQAKYKLTTGQLMISEESTQEGDEPVHHVVVGQMLVEPDVTAADLERMLGSLVLVGQVICPESAMGVLKAKMTQMVGQLIAYSSSGRLMKGRVTLDEGLLMELEDGIELVVLGTLSVPQVLPADLLERKIGRLQVIGSVRCPEENAGTIRARLTNGSGRMEVVPTGYVLVEKPLVLDNAFLEVLPGSKLYCLAGVQIEADVKADRFDARIEGLISKELVLCPSALRVLLASKCNLLETRVVFYEGTLWLVRGEEWLAASRFEYLEGKATLVVEGELTVDAEVEPGMLAERLDKVYNLGSISCTAEQRSALEARLGSNDGEFVDSTKAEEAKDEIVIGNVNHLML